MYMDGQQLQDVVKSLQQVKQFLIICTLMGGGRASGTTSPIWRVLIGEYNQFLLIWYALHNWFMLCSLRTVLIIEVSCIQGVLCRRIPLCSQLQ